MKRLLIVSNRLPTTFTKQGGKLERHRSAGGLATGLSSVHTHHESLWIGWPGIVTENMTEDERQDIKGQLERENCFPVFLSQRDFEDFYHGFSNETIWPLYHYFTELATYKENYFISYQKVNELFSRVIARIARPDDIIWIHDYQLMLLPQLVREKIPDALIGYFLHIPFPSFEVYRLLPWRDEVLRGLLGADLIGFHTYDYVLHFLDSVHRLLGQEHLMGQIEVGNRVVKADIFPMGIDFDRFVDAVESAEVQREFERICKKLDDRRIVLSVDRLDYSKGIPQRLEAFDRFLEKYPEYKEQIVLFLVVVPSRTEVEVYARLKKQIEELVGKINGKHGTIRSMPIWYHYRSLPFANLVALYRAADVALITPMRDGMNLVAKEFIASRTDGRGTLILSEMTGASQEMGEAIIINPNNKEEIADAIHEALTMPADRQLRANQIMRTRLERYNVVKWSQDFIERLSTTASRESKHPIKRVGPEIRQLLWRAYQNSERRLVMLDYDGTLITFFGEPEEARPDPKLLAILKELSEDDRNEVVLISGRDRRTLEEWFGDLNISIVAEHGSLIKEQGGNWRTVAPFDTEWKKSVRPILELYTDRTPGSFIEEKQYSLVWHYRKAGPPLATVRYNELEDVLEQLTSKLDLEIMEGEKVIEIKNAGVDKGRAAIRWLERKGWDFILAIGDDTTDEDLFAVLPESAYSIKVGFSPSKARLHIESVDAVRELLKSLIQTTPAEDEIPNDQKLSRM